MKGMRGGSLAAIMATVLFSNPYKHLSQQPKLSKKQLAAANGEYQRHKESKGMGSLNQRQKRKLCRQNPHLRKKVL